MSNAWFAKAPGAPSAPSPSALSLRFVPRCQPLARRRMDPAARCTPPKIRSGCQSDRLGRTRWPPALDQHEQPDGRQVTVRPLELPGAMGGQPCRCAVATEQPRASPGEEHHHPVRACARRSPRWPVFEWGECVMLGRLARPAASRLTPGSSGGRRRTTGGKGLDGVTVGIFRESS